MSDAQTIQADLSESPLPEALAAVDRMKVPGILEARQEGVVKKLFVRGGRIVHAVSDQREDSLGAHLVRSHRLSAESLDGLTTRRLASEKRFGELLVEADLMSPADVLQGLRDHIESIVWGLFDWTEGTVEFKVGELRGDVPMQIQLPITRAILDGVRGLANPKVVVARLGQRETVMEPCYRTEALIRLGLEGDEVRLLRHVNGERTLFELFGFEQGRPADNARLLYAFWVLRLIRRGKQSSHRAGPVKVKIKATGDSFPS